MPGSLPQKPAQQAPKRMGPVREEILFLNSFNVPAIDMLKRLDVSWTMWKQIITENHLTRLQNETYNACRWYYLKQQHPDWTDQQITQARRTSESSFNDFMQDDRPAL